LAQIGKAGGWAIVGPALVESIDGRFDNVRGSVEIGLANFEVDDVPALALESASFIENFKRSFSAEPGHAAGELQFVLEGFGHDGELLRARRIIRRLRTGSKNLRIGFFDGNAP
jgi:hypothetical protein